MAKKRVSTSVATQPPLEQISVLTADLNDPDQTPRGLFTRLDDIKYARVKISTAELSANLQGFFRTIEGVMTTVPASLGGLYLDEISLAVEVSAKGTVSLLGTGGEVAGKTGLTFKLKRQLPK